MARTAMGLAGRPAVIGGPGDPPSIRSADCRRREEEPGTQPVLPTPIRDGSQPRRGHPPLPGLRQPHVRTGRQPPPDPIVLLPVAAAPSPSRRRGGSLMCCVPNGAPCRAPEGRSGIWARNEVETPPKGVPVRATSRVVSSSACPRGTVTVLSHTGLRPHFPAPAPLAADTSPIERQKPASSAVGQAASFNRLYPECRPSLPPRLSE